MPGPSKPSSIRRSGQGIGVGVGVDVGMGARLLPLLLLPFAGCTDLVPVAAIQPVCGREEVVVLVNDELRRRALYTELIRPTAAERTAPSGTESQCAAYARQVTFNAGAPGGPPAVLAVPVGYTVRRTAYGLVVELVPAAIPPFLPRG